MTDGIRCDLVLLSWNHLEETRPWAHRHPAVW